MNLITDPWIPVIRRNGPDIIKPHQIVDTENPVMEINALRPDFQGALYQFLIGLLQTCFAPDDEDEWVEYWEKMPTSKKVKSCFQLVADAFHLDNTDGPAFMQDYNLPDGVNMKITSLLIDAPGGNTLKDNLDLFVKRDQTKELCESCTASAIFTLQINAPSGGAGHRVGLRGGGPLTTLVVPETTNGLLWKKLWLNILSQEDFEEIPTSGPMDSAIFPWMAETRLSHQGGMITTPIDTHPLQMYWGVPRRIRFTKKKHDGQCSICGKKGVTTFRSYRTKKHGVNYEGPWVHPLTPYRFDVKKEKPPISLKGQRGGLAYKHWLGLTFQDMDMGDEAATIVQFFNNERGCKLFKGQSASLWCFGYDMNKMKARCWYDSHFPIFSLDEAQRKNIIDWGTELVRAAREVVRILRSGVKAARFSRPIDMKGDMSIIDQRFWQLTEPAFYQLIDTLAKLPAETKMAPPEIYKFWFECQRSSMYRIFEEETLYSAPEGLDLRRIVCGKEAMRKKFYANKAIKNLITKSVHEG